MATYVIGDIQGCFSPFQRLLVEIAFDPAHDRLWLVGDLVNRGPKNLEVLRWVHAHEQVVTCVLGNHDLHLIARHLGVVRPKQRDTIDDVLNAPDRHLLVDWLRRRPLAHREGMHLMVHAGLLPEWSADDALRLAREAQDVLRSDRAPEVLAATRREPARAWSEDLRGLARWCAILHGFTVLRTCREDGVPCLSFAGPPAAAPRGCQPWFRIDRRRSADVTVLFGHWAALGLHLSEHVIGIDSGAVWGNALSAVRLEDRALFQVPAKV